MKEERKGRGERWRERGGRDCRRKECLAIDVPAEEVMLDQHVLNALFQWPLLLLLKKGGGRQKSDKYI